MLASGSGLRSISAVLPPTICPDCSRPLPSGSGGFCPYCMLRGGLEPGEMDTPAFDVLDTSHDLKAENLETSLLGRYKLGSKLGEGVFGVIFKAHQRLPVQREVVVKVLRTQVKTAPILARFESERQALSTMSHPGVACVLDAGETVDGRLFFVMERVDGMPATTYVRQTSPPLRERLRLFISICEAVHHAHQKGVIHRDLKPGNILVTTDAGKATAKVADFGLAKALAARALGKHVIYTLHDQIIGTPGYISPELAEHGGEDADVRGDVYALGALLYEMLTGVPVVDQKILIGKPIDEALRAAAAQPFVPPSRWKPVLRGDLDAIVTKALASDPALRYASAEALAADVRRHVEGWPVAAHAPGRVYRMGKFARRHPVGMVMLALLVLAGCGTGWSVRQSFLKLREQNAQAAVHEAQRRRDSSRRSFHEARLLSEHGQTSEAMAHLARALREDPRNSTAAAYLTALLGQAQPVREIAADLRLKPGWKHVLHLAVNAPHRAAVAVCAADQQGRSDIIMRWDLDAQAGTVNAVTELGLPAGLRISAVQTGADDEFLILGFSDGSLARYDIGAGTFFQFDGRLAAGISALAISGDGKQVMAVANQESGSEARLWDVRKTEPASRVHRLSQAVERLVMDQTAGVAILSHGKSLSSLRPMVEQEAVSEPRAVPEGFLAALAVNPQGTQVAAGMWNGHVLVLDVKGGLAPLGAPLISTAPVTDLCFQADGEVLYSGDSQGVVMSWSTREMRPLSAGVRLDGSIRLCRVLGRNQPRVLAISGQGEQRLWQPGGRVLSRHQGRHPVDLCAASSDGSLTMDVPIEGTAAEVWELHGRMIRPREWTQPVPPPPPGAAMSGELPDGAEFHPDDPLSQQALTPDGRQIITITSAGTHRVWDARTGDPLTPPFRCQERATKLQALADGSGYLYCREDGVWMQLPLPAAVSDVPEWFMDFAEARAGMQFRADGSSTSVKQERQQEIIQSLPASESGPLVKLARWLMKPAAERVEWPER